MKNSARFLTLPILVILLVLGWSPSPALAQSLALFALDGAATGVTVKLVHRTDKHFTIEASFEKTPLSSLMRIGQSLYGDAFDWERFELQGENLSGTVQMEWQMDGTLLAIKGSGIIEGETTNDGGDDMTFALRVNRQGEDEMEGLVRLDAFSLRFLPAFRNFTQFDAAISFVAATDASTIDLDGWVELYQLATSKIDGQKNRAQKAEQGLSAEKFHLATKLHLAEGDAKWDLTARIASEQSLTTGQVYRFWPHHLAGNARMWLVDHMPTGTIDKPNLLIEGHYDKAGLFHIDDLAVAADLRGVTIHPYGALTPINNLAGQLRFDGDDGEVQMLFTVANGQMQESQITGGKVVISSLGQSDHIAISVQMETALAPLLKQLSAPPISNEIVTKLDLKTARGQALIWLELDFPLRDDLDFDQDAQFAASAKILDYQFEYGALQAPLYGQVLEFEQDESGYTLAGDMALATISGSFDLIATNLDHNKTAMQATYQAPIELSQLPYADLKGLAEGTADLVIHLQQSEQDYRYDLQLDLYDSALQVPQLGWLKPSAQPGMIQSHGAMDAKGLRIDRLVLLAGDDHVDLQGYLYAADHFDLKTRAESKFGPNRFTGQLRYSVDQGLDLDLAGPVLTVQTQSSDSEVPVEKPESDPLSADQPLPERWEDQLPEGRVMLAFDKVIMNEVPLSAVRLALAKKDQQIQLLSIEADQLAQDGKPAEPGRMELSYYRQRDIEGQFHFMAKVKDFGYFMRAFALSESIEGGTLQATGVRPSLDMPLAVEWQLDQFSLERTPLILSILDRVSLTRLWQISNLQTIYFPQAGGSLRYGASHIELSDWRFANASIAINLEGMIERPGQHIEIKGYIVPLSLLEKTLASIPLFGWLLTDNGQQPILVTAFTLDGDYDNPNVTFNPFETLLPGRLRNPVRDWFQAQPDTSQ